MSRIPEQYGCLDCYVIKEFLSALKAVCPDCGSIMIKLDISDS